MWDERYSEAGFAYGTTANDFLQAEFGKIQAGGNVLCLAEGEGRNAVFLAKQGYQVSAIDQSAVGMQKACELAEKSSVSIETEVCNLAEYSIAKEAWDGIVSIAAHLPPELRQAVHRQVVAGLKSGGVLILEAYTPDHIETSGVGGPPASQPQMFMTLQALRNELEGLDFEIARETVRHLNEGKYHQGESAVVQLVARKP